MRIRWRILACLCLGGLLVWFLADAGAVRDSVAEALALCARSVVPSLFPFLVASSALLALGFGELAAPWLAGLMEPLFRVPGAGSAALVLGLVGGYPIGAKTAADLYRENLVSREEAERLLAFCNNSGPAFILGVVGAGVFASSRSASVRVHMPFSYRLMAVLAPTGYPPMNPRAKAEAQAPFTPNRGRITPSSSRPRYPASPSSTTSEESTKKGNREGMMTL